jgi:hypothetical protein|nr:MAG TPA: hypothetical protein [Caudoviricetes sp.]
MKTFIFLIEKLGYKFKVEASCGGEALYKLMQENPAHEVFNDCIEGSPVGFNLTVLMRGEEIKSKIREFEVTLSEKGFSSSISSFEDICSHISDELLYPVSVLSPIKEISLNSDQDVQRVKAEIRNCVYRLVDKLQNYEGLIYELRNLISII